MFSHDFTFVTNSGGNWAPLGVLICSIHDLLMLEKSALASSNFNWEVKNTKASLTVSNSANDNFAAKPVFPVGRTW